MIEISSHKLTKYIYIFSFLPLYPVFPSSSSFAHLYFTVKLIFPSSVWRTFSFTICLRKTGLVGHPMESIKLIIKLTDSH